VFIVCICNTALFKLIPLPCTHIYSYMFSTMHPPSSPLEPKPTPNVETYPSELSPSQWLPPVLAARECSRLICSNVASISAILLASSPSKSYPYINNLKLLRFVNTKNDTPNYMLRKSRLMHDNYIYIYIFNTCFRRELHLLLATYSCYMYIV
jgi:hypothetical protein